MKEKTIDELRTIWGTQNNKTNSIPVDLDLHIIDQIASLFAIGPYYYYILNFQNHVMDFVHTGIKNVLGIEASTFSLDKLFEIMHPEDVSYIHEKETKVANFLLNEIPQSDIGDYKVAYVFRLKHKDGNYRTILHQVKALNISTDGKIETMIGIHTDVTYLNIPIDHSISFIGQHKPSYYSIPTNATYTLINNSFNRLLTKKEKEIIVQISEGHNFNAIAKTLNLSPHTINTHKRNILKKSACKNSVELMAKCIREGII